jgi:hypothetical protein
MIARFSEAVRILSRQIELFAAIILTVWLPGNILTNYIAYNVKGASDVGVLKLTMFIETIFGPIYIGALVYALFQIKSGRTVTYREAMTVGIKKWGTLLIARLAAGLFILLGLIAIVIPGMILAVRYSLLDAAVIVEDKWPAESRARSTKLTTGRRWQIFWSAVVFFVTLIVLSLAMYLPLDFIESLNIMPVGVVLDCTLDIAYAIIQIVIFLFYWESIQEEKCAGPAT